MAPPCGLILKHLGLFVGCWHGWFWHPVHTDAPSGARPKRYCIIFPFFSVAWFCLGLEFPLRVFSKQQCSTQFLGWLWYLIIKVNHTTWLTLSIFIPHFLSIINNLTALLPNPSYDHWSWQCTQRRPSYWSRRSRSRSSRDGNKCFSIKRLR